MEIVKFQPVPGSDGQVTGYLHTPIWEMETRRESFPAVIICPGGAYFLCSQRESYPVAMPFLARGYQVFILNYSVGEKAKGFRPLMELSETVRILREKAKEYWIDPDKIAVCGFSAGGHLAAGTAILWDAGPVQAALGADAGQNRPDAVVLSYPVITSGPYGHQGSFDCIAGGDAALRRQFSLENQVRPGLPPFFIWHTVTDGTVPVENSMLLAAALRKNQVPFELHLMADGRHGMSLCTAEVHDPHPHNAHWFALCREWLDDVFGYRAGADGDPDQPFFRHGGAKD